MAEYDENYLSDLMSALSIDDNHWEELGLSDNIRTQLIKIENDYESIFSWNIKQLTEPNQNLKVDLIDNVRGRLEIIKVMFDKDDKFHLNRFYLQLVASYELYNNNRYKESLLEIESVVKYLDICKFDKSNRQYSGAYHHIARATNAYIALTLKIDSEKLLKDVKQVNIFNKADKAAICAVKAKMFMEYPIKGNNIALELINQAITNYNESEWIVIWLKAKGRVRRYAEHFKMPGDDEIDAANKLCSTKSNPEHLIKASELFKEVGSVYKSINNHRESNKFYKLSTDIIKESIELANGDINHLNNILLEKCIDCPYLFPKSILNDFITKLTSIKNSKVDQILGLYYFKKMDYIKARIHFSVGMKAGNFCCALKLIKVECLLQPVNKFPYMQALNTMYNDFENPKRRLTVLSHILIYFNYCEQNPKEMMRYLKLYINQEIQDAVKKSHLIHSRPLNPENGWICRKRLDRCDGRFNHQRETLGKTRLLNDVKPVKIFNKADKAAICAVKAKIFMEYPIEGNNIALEVVNQAITNSIESEWIVIWLKAKGRVRRYAEPFKMPGDDEIDAANKLRSMKSNPEHLIKASELFKEVANSYININKHRESTKFFKLSTDIMKESIELANGDINQLNYLLLDKILDCPYLFPKSIVDNFISKLTTIKYCFVDQTLGIYYLKHEKDYVKARFHLSLGMAAGNFYSALQYVKVECLLQPVNKFPYVQTLNKMYNDFENPQRRITILSHILIYFNYCEQKPKEMMRYLKLYMDQDIQDAVKKSRLIFVRPLFDVGKFLKPNAFLTALTSNIEKSITYNKWDKEEKSRL
ncbi:hypothetical protein ACI65C_007848 [Semiaphis heraclei]